MSAPRTAPTSATGTGPRVLTTKAGDVELAIPKLRKGSFFPSILEPRRRIDQALYAVVMEAYVDGVSTRAVDELVEAMGIGSRDLEVRGQPHLCRPRRGGGGLPGPPARPRRASLTSSWTPPTCTCATTTR